MSIAPGYIAVSLPEIPEGTLAVDLYFPMGDAGARKLVRVHPAGSTLSAARRAQMLARGIRFLWIKESDEPEFVGRLNSARPRASLLAQYLLDSCLILKAPDRESWAQEEATLKACLEIICRAVNRPGVALSPAWNELSRLALSLPLSTHSIRVATYVALFAMEFEHEDPHLLSDLMTAGLLHDLGMIAVGAPLASAASQKVPEENSDLWKTHPETSIQLIEKYAPDVSERARLWIVQHHERFGGGGYPAGLEGYKVDDISQLLAAADLLDELASGLWDERRRGLKGAFETLEDFDREKTFPQVFNPDLLKAMLGWSKRTKFPARSAAA